METKSGIASSDSQAGRLLDLVRAYLGVALFFKGVSFIQHGDYLLDQIQSAGSLWFAPVALQHMIIPLHLFGGLMLAVGFFTRTAALTQIPILMGATFGALLPQSHLWGVAPNVDGELACLVLFLCCVVFLHGGGRYSLDHLLKKSETTPEGHVPRSI